MSAKVEAVLDAVDEKREGLLMQLPWYKRFNRRYMKGDSFWSYHISSLVTWPQGIAVGFTLSKVWGSWVVSHPTATAAVVKVWGFITSAFTAGYNIVTHSQ